MKKLTTLFIFTLLIFPYQAAWSYKLFPDGTKVEKIKSYIVEDKSWVVWINKVFNRGLEHFTEPVHEEITQKIFGCEADGKICLEFLNDDTYAPKSVIAGVRWNDDPPFMINKSSIKECKLDQTIRLTTQPLCWKKLWDFAKSQSKKEFFNQDSKNTNLMYRSHFGDLQFIHSMATKDNENIFETQKNILMWSEFMWRIGIGEISGDKKIKDLKIDGLDRFFGKSGWNVQTFLSLGNVSLREHLDQVAFGSILHLIQDSFARGHTHREDPVFGKNCEGISYPSPGEIVSFHSYVNQDHEEHEMFDSRMHYTQHLIDKPNVVGVGKELKSLYERKASWDEVRPLMECVFKVKNT